MTGQTPPDIREESSPTNPAIEKKILEVKPEIGSKKRVKNNIVFGLTLVITLFAISVYSALSLSRTPPCSLPETPSSTSNSRVVIKADLYSCDLDDIKLWRTLLVLMSAGAAGGLVFELLNLKGNIEWPHGPTKDELAAKFAYASPENLYDLGYLARLIIGALSAPLAIAAVQPGSAFVMLSTSVVAGSSGALIFRSLQDRLVAAIYQREREIGEKQTADKTQKLDVYIKLIKKNLTEALTAFENLRRKVGVGSTIDLSQVQFPDDLNHVWSPLKIAREIAEAIEPLEGNQANKLKELLKSATDTFGKLQKKREQSSATDNFGEFTQENLDQIAKCLTDAVGVAETIAPTTEVTKNESGNS